jgi:ubiquinone/menaquinone biosynthesis C-methylase UbiE
MPVQDHSDVTRFGGVDATRDPGALIAFLDAAKALPGYRAPKQQLLDQLRLGQAWSALDVGCGTGADVIAMAECLPCGGQAVGIDISEAMLGEARRRAEGLDLAVRFEPGEAAQLPYDDASFGACRVETVLQHIDDPGKVIGEMARVTRPGGRITALELDQATAFLEHPDPETTRTILQTFAGAMASGSIGRQLPRLFRQAGLVDLWVSPTVVLSGAGFWEGLFRSHVRRLREDNVLTGAQAEQWWRGIAQREADGDFLGGAVIFAVAATRP